LRVLSFAQRKKKRQEKAQEQNDEGTNAGNKQNPKGVIVLGVYMHCEGCAKEVDRCLRGFDGVEVVETDTKAHNVIVRGKNADPTRVAERLRRKMNKHVDLISPILPKTEEKKEEKKPEPKVVEVVLKIFLHCEGCAKDVKHCIHKMEGVHTVEPDMKNNLVTVTGTIDAEKLVEFVDKRAGRRAEIVKQKQDGKNKKEDKNEGEGDRNGRKDSTCHNYPPGLVYAPQLFSDENPNACSVM
ncbi:hypothetical protein RJ639_033843, partial [Escallonia herrerae]